VSVRLNRRWWIVNAFLALYISRVDFLNVAAADDVKTPKPAIPFAVTTNTAPAEPAGNIGTNTAPAGVISAPLRVSADRVRRIQTVQRVEPEILQISPNLSPARLD
jgi:hypothetical protein